MNPPNHRKILILNTHGIFSGAEMVVKNLIPRVRQRTDFDFMVGCPQQGPLWKEISDIGVPLVELDISGKWNRRSIIPTMRDSARIVNHLTKILRDERVSLVHGNEMKLGLLGFIAAKRMGIPTLWYVHDFVSHGYFDNLCFYFADRVVVVSEAVGSRFQRLNGFDQKVVRIYNGIDVGSFAPRQEPQAVRAEWGLAPDTAVIGTVGRTDADKNVGAMVQVLARLRPRWPGLRGLIVGTDGKSGSTSGLEALQRQAHDLGLGSTVVFTGHRTDVADLMNVLDVFVSTAVAEPFGLTYLEAMALGKPIVAFHSGGTPEVVPHGECGLLVPSGDVPGMVEAIGRLLADPALRAQFGANGRKRVEAHFDVSRQAGEIAALYVEMLERLKV